MKEHIRRWHRAVLVGTWPRAGDAGFKVGASVSVETTVGQLVITLVEFPSSTQHCHYSAFERHIAKRGHATQGGNVVHKHPD
jgi:hypothetical protein